MEALFESSHHKTGQKERVLFMVLFIREDPGSDQFILLAFFV